MSRLITKRVSCEFKLRHFGKSYSGKRKEGLYLVNCFALSSEFEPRYISPQAALELSEWLRRYVNTRVKKKNTELETDTRAKARAIIRNAEKREAML